MVLYSGWLKWPLISLTILALGTTYYAFKNTAQFVYFRWTKLPFIIAYLQWVEDDLALRQANNGTQKPTSAEATCDMKHEAGNHSQIYCSTLRTHFLCSGYRSDNEYSLRSKLGLDTQFIEGTIEILCSCTCHDRGKLAAQDRQRYEKAYFTTLDIFGTVERRSDAGLKEKDTPPENISTAEPSVKVVTLSDYLAFISAEAADRVLDAIYVRGLTPVAGYAVYEQCYFLFLHLALRSAFNSMGSDARDSLQDSLSPRIFKHVPAYLESRYQLPDLASTSPDFIQDMEATFWDRLNRSEFDFSQELEHEGMKNQVAERLTVALSHRGIKLDSSFPSIVKQAIGNKGLHIAPLVDGALRGD